MSEKGGDPMSVSKGKRGFFVKLLCFVLALAAGGALGVGGTLFFQWQALPPPEEVFPYWYEPPAPVREESGVIVKIPLRSSSSETRFVREESGERSVT